MSTYILNYSVVGVLKTLDSGVSRIFMVVVNEILWLVNLQLAWHQQVYCIVALDCNISDKTILLILVFLYYKKYLI